MKTQPQDFFSDTSRTQLYTIDQLFGLPEFVKSASAETQALPSTVYGDPYRRLYPCHTKAATWLSQTYFLMNQHLYDSKEAGLIQERIKKAADYFGMEGLINNLADKWQAANTQQGVKDADYALVVEHDGQTIKRMPLNSPDAIKASAAFFVQNRKNYPYEWRKTAARNILKVSNGVGIDPQTYETIEKSAGYGFSDPNKISEAISERAALLPDRHSELHASMMKLSEDVKTLVPRPLFLMKVAESMDTIDREIGLNKFYDNGIQLPEDVCFEWNEKTASESISGFIKLTTGNAWPVEQLQSVDLHKIANVLGDEFVQAVTSPDGVTFDFNKFAEIVPTLPKNDASLLETALKASLNA